MLRVIAFLLLITFSACETLQKGSNSTSTVFTLNGNWELTATAPEQSLVGTVVNVAPFIPEGRITKLLNNNQCYRENDVKWKNIGSDGKGGFTLNNLVTSCTAGTVTYLPATISVVTADEIKLHGKNAAGQDNIQTWRRVR